MVFLSPSHKECSKKQKFNQNFQEYLEKERKKLQKDTKIEIFGIDEEKDNKIIPFELKSKIIACVYDSTESKVFTVNEDLLIRVWDIVTSDCIQYIVIETRED